MSPMTLRASASSNGWTDFTTSGSQMYPSLLIMNVTITLPWIELSLHSAGYLMFFLRNCSNSVVPPGNSGCSSTTIAASSSDPVLSFLMLIGPLAIGLWFSPYSGCEIVRTSSGFTMRMLNLPSLSVRACETIRFSASFSITLAIIMVTPVSASATNPWITSPAFTVWGATVDFGSLGSLTLSGCFRLLWSVIVKSDEGLS